METLTDMILLVGIDTGFPAAMEALRRANSARLCFRDLTGTACQLKLTDLGPFMVDIDCRGNNYFDMLDAVIEENRKRAYEYLGIPEDFQYTRLY